MYAIRVSVKRKVLHTVWYGTFVIEIEDGSQAVVNSILAEKDPSRIAEDLNRINNGEVLDREKELSENIDGTTDQRLLSIGKGLDIVPARDVEIPGPGELNMTTDLLTEASILLSTLQGKEGPDDSTIMSGVGALTDIDSSLNLITERMREWYSKYWEGISPHLEDLEILEMIVVDPDPRSLFSRIDKDLDAPTITAGGQT